MSQTVKRMIAAALFVALGWVGLHTTFLPTRSSHDEIEGKVQARAKEALERQGYDWAEVRAEGQAVVLSGFAPNVVDQGAAAGVAKRAWGSGGIVLGGVTVVRNETEILAQLDALSFKAVRSEEGPVVLEGFVPNKFVRERIVGHAQSLFQGGVEDRLRIASGGDIPEVAWRDGVIFGLDQLARLRNGTLSIDGASLTLTGETPAPAHAEAIERAVRGAPEPFDGRADISILSEAAADEAPKPEIKSADVCQETFDQLLREEAPTFGSNSAEIDPSSHRLLNELADTAQRCARFSIRIEGHTDATGSDARNLELSSARAGAVLDFLVAQGVPRERLHSEGFGASRPRASNATADGRALNRRIEFKIVR